MKFFINNEKTALESSAVFVCLRGWKVLRFFTLEYNAKSGKTIPNLQRKVLDASEEAQVNNYIVRIVQLETDLRARPNDEEKEIFEKFVNCTNEMYGIAERDMFVRGFTLGIKLIIEVMSSENG